MFFLFFYQIREELRANGIDVYPQKEFDEDAEDRMINEKIRVRGLFHYTKPSQQTSVSNLHQFDRFYCLTSDL